MVFGPLPAYHASQRPHSLSLCCTASARLQGDLAHADEANAEFEHHLNSALNTGGDASSASCPAAAALGCLRAWGGMPALLGLLLPTAATVPHLAGTLVLQPCLLLPGAAQRAQACCLPLLPLQATSACSAGSRSAWRRGGTA